VTIATAPHTTFSSHLPIVWLTKYRQTVLRGEAAERVWASVREECQKARVDILQGHIAPDHVHVMISIPPHVTIRRLIQQMKGTSSYRLLAEFPPSSALQRWGPYERTGLAEPLLVSCQRCCNGWERLP
jgi:REP element-mobilizing transposase RayT